MPELKKRQSELGEDCCPGFGLLVLPLVFAW